LLNAALMHAGLQRKGERRAHDLFDLDQAGMFALGFVLNQLAGERLS
jgi:hypothetical protein